MFKDNSIISIDIKNINNGIIIRVLVTVYS